MIKVLMVVAAMMVVSLEARGYLDNMIAHAIRDGAPNAVRVYICKHIWRPIRHFTFVFDIHVSGTTGNKRQ